MFGQTARLDKSSLHLLEKSSAIASLFLFQIINLSSGYISYKLFFNYSALTAVCVQVLRILLCTCRAARDATAHSPFHPPVTDISYA